MKKVESYACEECNTVYLEEVKAIDCEHKHRIRGDQIEKQKTCVHDWLYDEDNSSECWFALTGTLRSCKLCGLKEEKSFYDYQNTDWKQVWGAMK